MSKVIALLLLSLLAVSCGDKKGTSAVKLKLFQSNITTGVTMDGGILLMGRSEDGLNSFRTSLGSVNESLSMDLAKGRWEFAAVGWTSVNGPMTGENRCAYTGFVDLKDPEVNVSFNMSQARCLSDFNGNQFSDTAHQTTSGKFLEFFPIMCNENIVGNSGCYSAANLTSIQSYKVIYKNEAKGLANGFFSPLSSNCLLIGTSPRVRIPVTSATNGTPLNVTTVYYKNAACTGEPAIVYDFKNGIIGNQLPVWNQVDANSTNYSYFYVNPGAQYDTVAVNPSTLTMVGPLVESVPAFATSTTNYSLPSLPANVAEVCLTKNTVCPNDKWIPAQLLTGQLILDGALTDGSYVMRLFYKTVAGVVSSTPAEANFKLDLTAPQTPNVVVPTVSLSSGIYASWTASDASSFSHWSIEVCSDVSCSTIIHQQALNAFSNKSLNIPSANIVGGLGLAQTYCVRIKSVDVFARFAFGVVCAVSSL